MKLGQRKKYQWKIPKNSINKNYHKKKICPYRECGGIAYARLDGHLQSKHAEDAPKGSTKYYSLLKHAAVPREDV